VRGIVEYENICAILYFTKYCRFRPHTTSPHVVYIKRNTVPGVGVFLDIEYYIDVCVCMYIYVDTDMFTFIV